ncbi:hypothetical protein [Sneathia sanguinegens]|uniref:hypothetical protein n=1 Tax=Sneathia sanguinegens TaxID=40543 RepID=UPI002583265C|nr:hypothetical protein [Sneathia sanguinegens]MDU4652802.1 hypothetical protein [Sneathia sanguinegens]
MRKLKTNKKSVDTLLKESPNLYKYNQIILRLMGCYKYIFNLTNKNILNFIYGNEDLKIECDYINNYWFPGIEAIVKRYIKYANKINLRVPLKIVDNKKLKAVVDIEITKVRMELIANWTLDIKPSETDVYILNMLACHILINRYIYHNLMKEHLKVNEIREIKLLLGLGKKPLADILIAMSEPKVIEKIKEKLEEGDIKNG